MSKRRKKTKQVYPPAFEKWWRENEDKSWWYNKKNHTFAHPWEMAEVGWRAALEWIYYEGVLDPSLAGDLIKKELK